MNILTTDYSMATQSLDIFLSGCCMGEHCPGCHNTEAWDFKAGKHWKEYLPKIIKDLKDFDGMISRIFILGGEPLDQDMTEFRDFLSQIKVYNKEIWLFTRYELDEIDNLLRKKFDYIKTGPYREDLSVDNYYSYGIKLATSNQKVHKFGVDFV